MGGDKSGQYTRLRYVWLGVREVEVGERLHGKCSRGRVAFREKLSHRLFEGWDHERWLDEAE